jgi:hypothetical protein
MKDSEHSAGDRREINAVPRILDEAYILLTIAWATPLSKSSKPQNLFKYYILSIQTLKPFNHENV